MTTFADERNMPVFLEQPVPELEKIREKFLAQAVPELLAAARRCGSEIWRQAVAKKEAGANKRAV